MEIEPGIEDLIGDLVSGDPARAAAAAERLAAHGEPALPVLLSRVRADHSPQRLKVYGDVLTRIGPPAFDAVLAAARAGEVDDWLRSRLLRVFDERCAGQYAALALDPDRWLSNSGLEGLLRLRVDSDAGMRALVEKAGRGGDFYGDPGRYLHALWDSYAPRLRDLCRNPASPRPVRRGALALLIEGGGLDALDERDRLLVERLLRVKLPGSVRAVPDTQLSAWWLAVPGATYEGVFEALGLHDPRPVPVQTGVAAAMCEEIPNPSPEDPSRGISRAFVTPELDGWRLVFGQFPQLVGYDDWNDMVETVERVSAACGRAQLFFVDDAGGADIWFDAEDGRMVRQYAGEGDLEDDEEDEDPDDITGGVRDVCGDLSVDLDLVGVLDTVVRGHGWLAVTAPDMNHGQFPGVLPV
ncbi:MULTISPECIES: hypothetical protein [unclassified Streptomyces]|uniref:hypothetical protein n=1 Tax=unclassified Streptomyces TaxID=2593676 RepID=UPI000367CE3F|nr:MULTISPECIES: hypothetical protein [unclassified Streptomyces]MYQ79871.1 hypothetical protein [Streptomyces sp. SID4923]